MDARLHSNELRNAVIEGITTWCKCCRYWSCTYTSWDILVNLQKYQIIFLMGNKINGALIITASHNPKEYNGLKMTFDKHSLSEADIKEVKKMAEENNNKSTNNEKTVQDVIDSMNEEQKTVLYALVGQALEENENDEGDNKEMKHNVFSDSDENYTGDTISHAEIAAAITDAKDNGSMKEQLYSARHRRY